MPIRCRSRSPETIASELAATAHTREHGHHQGPTEIGQKFADDDQSDSITGLFGPPPTMTAEIGGARQVAGAPGSLSLRPARRTRQFLWDDGHDADRHDAWHHHRVLSDFLRDQCGGSSAPALNRAPLLRRAPVSDGGDRSRGIAAGYIAWPLDGVMVHCIGRPIISCTCSRRLAPALAGTKSRRCWWHMCPTN